MKKFSLKWWVIMLAAMLVMPLSVLCCSNQVFYEAKTNEENLLVSEGHNNISLVRGDFGSAKIGSAEDAYALFDNLKTTFKFSSSRENLLFEKTIDDVDGGLVYVFDQIHDGVRIYGAQINVCTDKHGNVLSISGKYYFDLKFDSSVNYSIDDAYASLATEELVVVSYKESVYLIDENSTYLTYAFSVSQPLSSEVVYVSARTLWVAKRISLESGFLTSAIPSEGTSVDQVLTNQYDANGNTIEVPVDKYTAANGSYFYILADSSKNIWVTDGKNSDKYTYEYYMTRSSSGNFYDSSRDSRIAVEAYKNLLACYDFYADENSFGMPIVGLRNTSGQPIKLIAIVHFGTNYENAGYVLDSSNKSQGYFVFGDGYYVNGTRNFVYGLDVVGHEYTHCITDSIRELAYENESGALCEAYADIFGSVIEATAKGYTMRDPNFWRVGEDLYRDDAYIYQNAAFRDMSSPRTYGCVDSYNNLYPLCHENHNHDQSDCDNGGVHHNCTIMTYATYLMYCQDQEFFNEYNILRLWYKTLTKLTENATFKEFADSMVVSASELDGGSWPTNVIDIIKFAFASVGIPGYESEKIWGGNNLTSLQGSGTIAKPFIIKDAASLASAMFYINNLEDAYDVYRTARYSVTNNISLGETPWQPIGKSEKPFEGVFNGGGYTISGLNLQNGEQDFNGLFGIVGEGGYIANVNIGSGITHADGEFAGAIVGKLMGTIDNCSSRLSIFGENVGGLVGLIENAKGGNTIINCYADCTLDGNVVGGLASYFATGSQNADNSYKSGMVSGSYFAGKVSGEIVGGFLGVANGVILVNNISVASLEGTTKSGYIGKLAFKNVRDSSDTVRTPVLNMFLNCYYVGSGEDGTFGILFGSVDEMSTKVEGNIIIERCIVKKIGNNEKLYNASNKALNIILKDVVYSSDSIFSGVFDFDNINFYKAEENFVAFEGASSFDTTIYRINGLNTMPVFVNTYTWLRYAASSFNGGDGSAEHPYEIDNAEQLARLASMLIEDAPNYYNKHYVLTSNIDLEGKIWVGIGFSVYYYVNGVQESEYSVVPFSGTFDGNGHTIFNLTSVDMASTISQDSMNSNFTLYDYGTGLFGVTSNDDDGTTAVIKNVRIEDALVQGSIVGGVVAEAYDDITITNANVVGGKLSSLQIAGGIVGILGRGTRIGSTRQSNINNCFVHTSLSGKIVGGAVGYALNGSSLLGSSNLTIKNFLLKGEARVVNAALERRAYESEALFGGVVGGFATDNLLVVNTVLMGEALGYTNNTVFGGFVGKIVSGSQSASNNINIQISGSKLVSKFVYVLSYNQGAGASVPVGTLVGTIDENLALGRVNIRVSSNTHTNVSASEIYKNASLASVESSMVYDSKNAFTSGPFDFYDRSLYSNPNYFDQDSVWSDSLVDRMYFVITFLDSEGNVIKAIPLRENQTLDESLVPTTERASTQVNEYTFVGWDKPLDKITRSMTLRPVFESKLRDYTVKYLDENGNVIETRTKPYGSSIDQDVQAPEKKSSLFFSYKFERWGKRGDMVLSDIEVRATYKKSLTGFGVAVIVFAVLLVAGVGGTLMFASNKKNKNKRSVPLDE